MSLSITREQFRELYHDLPILQDEDLFFNQPQTETEMYTRYMPSKLWRLNNLYTIVDKYGTRIRFCMNYAQHRVYAASLRHPRIIILKSRQQGISTFWLVSFFDDSICNKDYSIGLMAQGLDESSTLLERTKILWEELGSDIKAFLNIKLKTNNTKEFSLTNGSTIFVRTSFRSTTLQRLHVSEMGKIANKNPDKARETKTGTLQAIAQGNIVAIESTAEGDNIFKTDWDNAVTNQSNLSPKDFYPVFLSWVEDPDCWIDEEQPISKKQTEYFTDIEKELGITLKPEQKYFWVVQFRELGDKIYQEYPTTPKEAFMATKDGTYWANGYYEHVTKGKREVDNLFDKNLDVELSVDLGMDDTNVLLAHQYYTDGFRFIDEYTDSGKDIKYYCQWIREQPWFRNLSKVILPHDAEVRELTSGKTRTEVFEDELEFYDDDTPTNIYVEVLPRTESINEDIEKVRQILHILWLDKKCEYIKMCMLNYQKEWNETKEMWRNTPLHNEASHGAAAVRYGVIGSSRTVETRRSREWKKPERKAGTHKHYSGHSAAGMDI